MKKVIVFFLLACIIIFSNAQPKFGLIPGENVSSLAGKDVNAGDFDCKAGFYAGGTVNIAVSKHFSIQPKLFFTDKG